MSKATQIEFENIVRYYYLRHKRALSLSDPSFESDGFITTATMIGAGGSVEIRCGPSEYHAEIFIQTLKDNKRWSLTDLISIKIIQNWMLKSRPNISQKHRLKAEIETAFCLLVDGLKDVEEFKWLKTKLSQGHDKT